MTMPGTSAEGEHEEHGLEGKAVVTIKFVVDKDKLKKVVQAASGGDDGDGEESGSGKQPVAPYK